MAMDSLRNPHCAETLVLCAVDAAGTIGGFLQFVPTYGRDAVSLSLMRRRHDTPNGLTEFMIVKAIEALRDRGVAEVSLNFAAFARLLREPATAARARGGTADRARRHLVPDRAALPLQRQVLPALGAALLHVRAALRPPAGRASRRSGSRASSRGRRCARAVAHSTARPEGLDVRIGRPDAAGRRSRRDVWASSGTCVTCQTLPSCSIRSPTA